MPSRRAFLVFGFVLAYTLTKIYPKRATKQQQYVNLHIQTEENTTTKNESCFPAPVSMHHVFEKKIIQHIIRAYTLGVCAVPLLFAFFGRNFVHDVKDERDLKGFVSVSYFAFGRASNGFVHSK